MHLTAPVNTLKYQVGARPLARKMDGSGQPVKAVMAVFDPSLESKPTHPETEAIKFYLLSHVMGHVQRKFDPEELLPHDVLEIVEAYNELLAVPAKRLFQYLVKITTREARHVHSKSKMKSIIGDEFGEEVGEFIASLPHEPQAAKKIVNDPPDCTIGTYAKAIAFTFYKGSFSGGYGGGAWGNIADCLSKFIHGEYSAAMMMDVGWTLCHNGGPIFNKSMEYNMYNSGSINMILDVQRSGQIPQLIEEGLQKQYVDVSTSLIFKKIKAVFPELVGEGYVDWFLVKEMGALHNWSHKIESQKAKHGMPTGLAKKVEAAKEAKKEAVEQGFEVMPGEFVPMFKPKRKQV